MPHLKPVWSVLIIAGIFLVDIYAQKSSTTESTWVSNTTTPAPSNTTTPAPSNTTTPAPSNTTHAPSNTTTPAPSNTTHAPSNTTTHAPSNTTTHAPSNTTTAKPTPTLAPVPSPPDSGNYTVKNGTNTCVIAFMGLELCVENATMKKYFNIKPTETFYNGTCGDKKANLLLTFPEGSINFVFVQETKVYYINEVSAKFSWPPAGHWEGNSTLKLLSTYNGYYVKCKNTPKVQLGEHLQLSLTDVRLQAFNITNGVFGSESVCYPDRTKTLIPVGVALAIVGLILIILFVLLLTRRRRMTGYEQI